MNSYNEVSHFRIITLLGTNNPFAGSIKHEYHVTPKEALHDDDLRELRYSPEESSTLIDDAFFRSTNSAEGQIMRVSVFAQEFSQKDLVTITDRETITRRYTLVMESRGQKADDSIGPVTCFRTLIKVLKGPVLLGHEDKIKTINLETTTLEATVDVNLLLELLGFEKVANELVPPNLSQKPLLRESYIRKILELQYLGRVYAISSNLNNDEFVVQYSYLDNLSLVFTKIPEIDKLLSIMNFAHQPASLPPAFIILSCCTYFADEMVVKCFENTVASDVHNCMHYVDALQSIAGYNNSTKITKYVSGLPWVGYREYVDCMHALGVEHRSTDDQIIAQYVANYKDDPKNYVYFNGLVRKIARARDSSRLRDFLDTEVLPYRMAMDELGVESNTEDEVVITAYEFKLDEVLQSHNFNVDAPEVLLLPRLLASVAIARKSFVLLTYVETKIPNLCPKPVPVSMAQLILSCTSQSTDAEIFNTFLAKVAEGTTDIRLLRGALRALAEHRKSANLIQYLRTGKNDPSLLPAQDWPTGLDNIGNTCYLNSLLQFYFCLRPLRDLVLQFDGSPTEDMEVSMPSRKIGGRTVDLQEVKRANQFMYHLQKLFLEMIGSNRRCVQPSKELAYLSFLPLSQPVEFKQGEDVSDKETLVEEHDKEFEGQTKTLVEEHDKALVEEPDLIEMEDGQDSSIVEKPPSDVDVVQTGSVNPDSNLIEGSMEDVHIEEIPGSEVQLTGDEERPVSYILPISTDQMESTIELGRQQDVTECIENVIFLIETALQPEHLDEDGEQYDLIKKLFSGKTKQTITTPKNEERVSFERFFSLIINVSDHPKNIYDSLDNYFSDDLVTLEEGVCKKNITISELPEILQFHVQRVMFDRERLVAYKSLEHIPFSETIYLDRYLDTTDPEILKKRSEVFAWKSELARWNARKEAILQVDATTGLNIIDSLAASKKYLEEKIANHDVLCVDPSTIATISRQWESLRAELVEIDAKCEELHRLVSNQFADYKKVGYSIFAIFIHRGEASYGHYWIYIKDPRSGMYRKYNDEIVTEAPESEVFNFVEGNTATPYYVVYVRDDLQDKYIEPLKREIKK